MLVYSWFGVSGLPQWRVVLVGPRVCPWVVHTRAGEMQGDRLLPYIGMYHTGTALPLPACRVLKVNV